LRFQAGPPGQLVHQADAARADRPNLIRQFHADARPRKHRPAAILARARQPPLDPLLATPQTRL